MVAMMENKLPKGVKNLIGFTTGKLTVIEFSHLARRSYWKCLCECGNTVVKPQDKLTSGEVKSCGCLKNKSFGHKKLYKVWQGIHYRTSNPKSSDYHNYGGRGIKVAPVWATFSPFLDWALSSGYEEGLTLDRIDTNGDYSPDNCRWTDWKVQALNRRHRKYVGIYKRGDHYSARLKRDGKVYYLGTYNTLDEAYQARCEAIDYYNEHGVMH